MIKLKDLIKEATVNIDSKFNAELIDNINDEYGYNFTALAPEKINDVFCDMWASLFVKKFGGEHQWSYDIPNEPNGHSWVKLNNKFYDAEMPKGTFELKSLPFFQRVIKKYGSEWLDDNFYNNIKS